MSARVISGHLAMRELCPLYPPKSGHSAVRNKCPLRAKSEICSCYSSASWQPSSISFISKILSLPLLLAQPRRPAAGQKILARRYEYVDHLGILVAPALVIDAAGDCGDAASFEHAPFLGDAEFHSALEYPHELLVWMRMGSHMRSGTYLPPHHHALLAGQHPARNLVADFFLRDRRKRPETRERSHSV